MEVPDDQLTDALKLARQTNPTLGWKKVVAAVNTAKGWNVDLHRGKSILKACNLMVAIPPKKDKVALPPPVDAGVVINDQALLKEQKDDEQEVACPARKKQKASSGVVVENPNPYLEEPPTEAKFGSKWSTEQLKDAVRSCKSLHPDYGVNRVYEYLKVQWDQCNAAHLDKKRVKSVMKDLGMVVSAPQHA